MAMEATATQTDTTRTMRRRRRSIASRGEDGASGWLCGSRADVMVPYPSSPPRSGCLHGAEAHQMEATIQIEDVAGEVLGLVRAQERGHVSHVPLAHVAVERRHLVNQREHIVDVADSAGRQRAHRSAGDAVHAHARRTEVPR